MILLVARSSNVTAIEIGIMSLVALRRTTLVSLFDSQCYRHGQVRILLEIRLGIQTAKKHYIKYSLSLSTRINTRIIGCESLFR